MVMINVFILVTIETESHDTVLLGEHALRLSQAPLCISAPQASTDVEISHREGTGY